MGVLWEVFSCIFDFYGGFHATCMQRSISPRFLNPQGIQKVRFEHEKIIDSLGKARVLYNLFFLKEVALKHIARSLWERFWKGLGDLLVTVLGMNSISKAYFQNIIFTKHNDHSFDDAFTKTHAGGPPQMADGG